MEISITYSRSSFGLESYSNVEWLGKQGYGRMPRVERNLANYLYPGTSSSLKAPILPTKPCQATLRLVGRAYAVADQTGGALHTMAVLQVYQADLLKDLDQGEGLSPEGVSELRIATDCEASVA